MNAFHYLHIYPINLPSTLHKKWSFPLRISSVNVIWSLFLKKSLMENFIFCAVPDAIFVHYSCFLALQRRLTKTLNQFLKLFKANKNLEICMSVLFEQLNESSQIWSTFFEWYCKFVLLRTHTLRMWSKCRKNYFLGFHYHLPLVISVFQENQC